jgi:hypothetical protein
LSEARDFWLSCGHHLLDRGEDGGLVVTDEFLKAYLARPEMAPPPDSCRAERAPAPGFAGRSATAGRASPDRGDRRRRCARELGIYDLLEGSYREACDVGGGVSRDRATGPAIPTYFSRSAGAVNLAQYAG